MSSCQYFLKSFVLASYIMAFLIGHSLQITMNFPGQTPLTLACHPLQFGDNLLPINTTLTAEILYVGNACGNIADSAKGKIALVDRGGCAFTDKVLYAEKAGAVGVIVVNNVGGSAGSAGAGFSSVAFVPAITIHSCMIGSLNNASYEYTNATSATLYGSEWVENPGDCNNENNCEGHGFCAYGSCVCSWRYSSAFDEHCSFDWLSCAVIFSVVVFILTGCVCVVFVRVFVYKYYKWFYQKLIISISVVQGVLMGVFFAGYSAVRNSDLSPLSFTGYDTAGVLGLACGYANVGIIVALCFRAVVSSSPRANKMVWLGTAIYVALHLIGGIIQATNETQPSAEEAATIINFINFLTLLLHICFTLVVGSVGLAYTMRSVEESRKRRTMFFKFLIISITCVATSVFGVVRMIAAVFGQLFEIFVIVEDNVEFTCLWLSVVCSLLPAFVCCIETTKAKRL